MECHGSQGKREQRILPYSPFRSGAAYRSMVIVSSLMLVMHSLLSFPVSLTAKTVKLKEELPPFWGENMVYVHGGIVD
jgi:hypothetical protein